LAALGALVILLAFASPASARDRVGDIEFYGYKGIDSDAVLRALPFHQGDDYSQNVGREARDAVKRVTSREATDVAAVCCDDRGGYVIFIGLPGESSKRLARNPPPTGTMRLPKEITDLDARFGAAIITAVRQGGNASKEDDSNGYALINYPPARTTALKIRQYALAHEDELLSVLRSASDPQQRAIAAEVLGYARQSSEQIAALAKAARDSNDDVRNNSARALAVLASSSIRVAREIPTETFVDMIRSGVWTDRNKASFVLEVLTRARDPKLLAELRAKALDALVEMARWRDIRHAVMARIILARIAGIPEDRVYVRAEGPVQDLLNMLRYR
jgi:hypothetical protein